MRYLVVGVKPVVGLEGFDVDATTWWLLDYRDSFRDIRNEARSMGRNIQRRAYII